MTNDSNKITFYLNSNGIIDKILGFETLNNMIVFNKLKSLQCMRNKIEKEMLKLMIKKG